MRLAARGHRVTLYDASHPREKPCGGGIPAGAFHRYPELRELARFGRGHHRVVLRAPRGPELRVELPEPIVIVARRVLADLLMAMQPYSSLHRRLAREAWRRALAAGRREG